MNRLGVGVVLVFVASLPALSGTAHAQSTTDANSSAEPVAGTPAECAARLRDASGPGLSAESIPRLADVCAELARELEAGVFAPALGTAGAGGLTAQPFEDLVELIEDYERPPHELPLAAEDLASIVESLRPFGPLPEVSLWDRIREWVRERLDFGDSNGSGGFVEWLRDLSIPDEWIRTTVYVLAFTIVIAALVVLVNELRLSGVLGDPAERGRLRGTRGASAPSTKRMPLTFDRVREAAPARQPSLLLAMVVERLRARFGDAVRDSLTHRELAAAARTFGVSRRGELEAVVAAAERVTFADWRPEPADVEPVIEKGRAVLDELEADPGQVTTSP